MKFEVDMWQVAVLSVFMFAIFIFGYTVTRLLFVLSDIYKKRTSTKFSLKRRKCDVKSLVIVGSGGHTTEILRLLNSLGESYCPRHYVLARTDKISEHKIHTFEEERNVKGTPEYVITHIHRSREVKQSWISTFFSTLYASILSLPIVFKSLPDLVLCNGPGTCIPLCGAAFLLSVLGLKKVTIVYVESLCRVQTLSLSGKILYYFADHILVQWPELKEKYPQTRYIGRLV